MCMESDELTSIGKGIFFLSSFSRERGEEFACVVRRGSRGVEWYVIVPFFLGFYWGSINNVNKKGDSVSPCSVPLSIRICGVLPTGVM